MGDKTLIFVPTYNEQDNAPVLCEELHRLGLDADVLFMDDNSPDGTGPLLEGLKARYARLIVQHRPGKLGVGSAHFDAIQWAYDHGYQVLVTLDCDFTHAPADIPGLIRAVEGCDIAIGSRWVRKGSLPGWTPYRRGMTMLGRFLTRFVLGIPQDASGAFRVYRLDRVPRPIFQLVRTRGYSFFFESLFIFNRNSLSIAEYPIVLPARTYGHSKMSIAAAAKSAAYVFELYVSSLRRPEQFLLEGRKVELDASLRDSQDWDAYWSAAASRSGIVYEVIAGLYRRLIIMRILDKAIGRNFPPGAALLHAGCGSGQVDANIQRRMRITAVDISPGALRLYARNNPRATGIRHASILGLPFMEASFDGAYNLGVIEHFSRDEIVRMLAEFRRVLKPAGRVVIFWPHRFATSVFVLRIAHFVLNRMLGRKERLHPAEISHCRGKRHANELLEDAGLQLIDYRFGLADGFVQAIVVAQKASR